LDSIRDLVLVPFNWRNFSEDLLSDETEFVSTLPGAFTHLKQVVQVLPDGLQEGRSDCHFTLKESEQGVLDGFSVSFHGYERLRKHLSEAVTLILQDYEPLRLLLFLALLLLDILDGFVSSALDHLKVGPKFSGPLLAYNLLNVVGQTTPGRCLHQVDLLDPFREFFVSLDFWDSQDLLFFRLRSE